MRFKILILISTCYALPLAEYDPNTMPTDLPHTKEPPQAEDNDDDPTTDLEPAKHRTLSASYDFFGNYNNQGHLTFKRNMDSLFEYTFDKVHYAFKPDNFHKRFALSYVHNLFMLPLELLTDAAHFHNAITSRINAYSFTATTVDWEDSSSKNTYKKHIRSGGHMLSGYTPFFKAWYYDSFGRGLRSFTLRPSLNLVDTELDKLNGYKILNLAQANATKAAQEVYFKSTSFQGNPPDQDMRRTLSGYDAIDRQWAVNILAAGFNSISDLMKEVEERATYGNLHFIDSRNYSRYRLYQPILTALAATDVYGGTLKEACNYLQTTHEKATPTRLFFMSLLANLLSSSFYRTLKHTHSEYLTDGTLNARAYFWRRLKIPDWHVYLNDTGPAMSMTSNIRINDNWWIPIDLEFTSGGAGLGELELGLVHKFYGPNPLHLEANAVFTHQGLGGRFKADLHLANMFQVKLGMDILPMLSLKGKRHGVFNKNTRSDIRSYSITPFVEVGLTY